MTVNLRPGHLDSSYARRLQRMRTAARCGHVWLRKPEPGHDQHTCKRLRHPHSTRHECSCGAVIGTKKRR